MNPTPVEPIEEAPVSVQPIDDVPACPLCGTPVSDLSATRCANCGHAFSGGSVELGYATGAEDAPRWLVEVARRPLLAAWSTAALALWPWSFWKRVKPRHTPNVRRLVLYGIGSAHWFAGILIVLGFLALVHEDYANSVAFQGWGPAPLLERSVTEAWDYLLYLDESWPFFMLVLAASLWGPLSMGALLIFQQTLRRAGVGIGHVLRAGFYAADMRVPILLVGALFVAGGVLTLSIGATMEVEAVGILALLGTAFLNGVRLTLAQVLYLRLPHTYRTAAAIQFMLFLVLMIVFLQIGTR